MDLQSNSGVESRQDPGAGVPGSTRAQQSSSTQPLQNANSTMCCQSSPVPKSSSYWMQRMDFSRFGSMSITANLPPSGEPEEFQRRLHGIQGVVVVADDILVFGKGKTEEARRDHDKALLQLLRRAREQNLTFNKDKMRLHLSELIYIGHQVSPRSTARSRRSVSSEEHGSAYLRIRCETISGDMQLSSPIYPEVVPS